MRISGHGDGAATCTGKETATWSFQVAWAVPNGVALQGDPCRPPQVALPPRKTPAQAGHDATDARNQPSERAALRISERSSAARCQGSTREIYEKL